MSFHTCIVPPTPSESVSWIGYNRCRSTPAPHPCAQTLQKFRRYERPKSIIFLVVHIWRSTTTVIRTKPMLQTNVTLAISAKSTHLSFTFSDLNTSPTSLWIYLLVSQSPFPHAHAQPMHQTNDRTIAGTSHNFSHFMYSSQSLVSLILSTKLVNTRSIS